MPTTSRGPAGRTSSNGPRSSSRRDRRSPSTGTRAGEQSATSTRRPRTGATRDEKPALQRPQARGSFTTRAAVLLGVVAILAASYAFPLRAWLDQRAQLATLTDQQAALAGEVDELEAARDLWDDPAYVRAQARERLNYVLPGEVGLVVLGTESTPEEEPVTGTLVPAASEGQPWWSTLVTAFVEVGNGIPAEASQQDDAGQPAGPQEQTDPEQQGDAQPGDETTAPDEGDDGTP